MGLGGSVVGMGGEPQRAPRRREIAMWGTQREGGHFSVAVLVVSVFVLSSLSTVLAGNKSECRCSSVM